MTRKLAFNIVSSLPFRSVTHHLYEFATRGWQSISPSYFAYIFQMNNAETHSCFDIFSINQEG